MNARNAARQARLNFITALEKTGQSVLVVGHGQRKLLAWAKKHGLVSEEGLVPTLGGDLLSLVRARPNASELVRRGLRQWRVTFYGGAAVTVQAYHSQTALREARKKLNNHRQAVQSVVETTT